MSKYLALGEYLRDKSQSQLPMTFAEIEKVIGAPLPPSAFKHRPFWSNNPGNSVMTRVWLDAGWISSDVDMDGRKLVFRRGRPAGGPPPTAGSPSISAPRRPSGGGVSLLVQGLSAETMKALEVKAEAAGTSVTAVAAELLTAHAKPTMAERLSFADRLRLAGRVVRGIDVPGVIRDDRDAR